MIFLTKVPINKGWSSDKKYCATDVDGKKYLLRVSNIAQHDMKQSEFNRMKQVAVLKIPMCLPIEFGVWNNEQYYYGFEAGQILKKIHLIPAPNTLENRERRFNRKMDYKIQKYMECPIKYKDGQAFIDYINENRHLIKNRPQVYQHGDYHIGNMMIDQNSHLYIIDFERNDYGDPWEEFNRIVWGAQKSPLFATDMVDGYFDNDIPIEFWKLLALYISSNTLSSVPWAIPFGKEQIEVMISQAKDILSWYDNMRSPIPTWYCKNFQL